MIKSWLLALAFLINVFQFSTALAENSNPKSLLITEGTYNKLSTREQKKYVKEVRKNYYEFEAVLNKDVKFATNTYDKYQFALSLIINAAVAEDDAPTFCVIGGADFNLSKGKTCPIQENLCKGSPDKFQCSEIFANKCVNVTPKEEISKRCYEESNGAEVNYPVLKEVIDRNYKNVCLDFENLKRLKQEHVAACHYLGAKLDKLNEPLEEEIRARLSSCENKLGNLEYENSNLNIDLNACLEKLPKVEEEVAQENLDCTLTGSRVNGSNLDLISGIQMFKKDSRMVRVLGNSQNVDAVNITFESGKACFSFEVTERAAKRFEEVKRLKDNTEFAQMVDGKIKGCTSNGVEMEKGKLFVPALLSRQHNHVTMRKDEKGYCQVGSALLRRVNGCFKGMSKEECERRKKSKNRGVSSVE